MVRPLGRFTLRFVTPGRIAAAGAGTGLVLVAQRVQEVNLPFVRTTFGGGGPIPQFGNGAPGPKPSNGGGGPIIGENLLPLLVIGALALGAVFLATRKKR